MPERQFIPVPQLNARQLIMPGAAPVEDDGRLARIVQNISASRPPEVTQTDPTATSAIQPTASPESAQLSAKLDSLNQPPTGRQALIKAILAVAPTAIAGAVGGLPAAAGAAQGTSQAFTAEAAQHEQDKQDLLKQVESARGREERMGERQLTVDANRLASKERLAGIEATNLQRKESAEATNQLRRDIAAQIDATKNRGLDITEEDKQSMAELRSAQADLAKAKQETEVAKRDPNSPLYKAAAQREANAAQRLSIAERRLGLSERTFDARYLGTDTAGNVLPGAMITDTNQPVGSVFSQNVRPTGQQRNKADMAASAKERMASMRSIVQNRPDIFGPAAGRTTDLTVWIGSQDPDAQRWRADAEVVADHLAGTFGGRNEHTLRALTSALGEFKDNPQAVLAGINELDAATDRFIHQGTPKTGGSTAAKPRSGIVIDPAGVEHRVTDVDAAIVMHPGTREKK